MKKSSSSISCSTCKALCCRLEVRLIDESDDQVPEQLTTLVDGQYSAMRQGSDGYCVAVDRKTLLCKIYEKRPYLCREYQVGDYDCINERKKLLTK